MQTELNTNIRPTLLKPAKSGIYRRYIKRPMDFILSLTAIILLSPVLLTVAILVKIYLGSPVIFKQKRPGLNEKIFTLYKFRTMTDERDENGELLPDSQRLTKFGKMLRATSLDELPELFNILKGDMSIVGPRPLHMKYLNRYNSRQLRRHEILPGITGLAQVNGRNKLSWEEKFEMDILYVENWNFWMDVQILYLTIIKVIKRDGISAEGHATMPEFLGEQKESSCK